MRARGIAAALVAAIVLPLAASAKDTVVGKLTTKTRTSTFSYVYAYRKAAWRNPTKTNLHVLFSDKPIPDIAIPKDEDAVTTLSGLTREGTVHAFELRFVGDDTSQLYAGEQGAIYDNGVSPGRMGVTGPLKYAPRKTAPSTIAGKVWVDPAMASTLNWSCEVTFEIGRPPR